MGSSEGSAVLCRLSEDMGCAQSSSQVLFIRASGTQGVDYYHHILKSYINFLGWVRDLHFSKLAFWPCFLEIAVVSLQKIMLIERRALALSRGRLRFSLRDTEAEGLGKKGPPVAPVSTQTNLSDLFSICLYLSLLAVSGPNNLFLIVFYHGRRRHERSQ